MCQQPFLAKKSQQSMSNIKQFWGKFLENIPKTKVLQNKGSARNMAIINILLKRLINQKAISRIKTTKLSKFPRDSTFEKKDRWIFCHILTTGQYV
jgi:hypothetical protein